MTAPRALLTEQRTAISDSAARERGRADPLVIANRATTHSQANTPERSLSMRPWLKHVEMRVRAVVPRPVKSAYRVARALSTPQLSSPAMPAALLDGCRMCADRDDLIGRLPKSGIVAELGTYRGEFARIILARAAPRQLHLIDIDFTLADRAVMSDPHVTTHEGLTHTTIATFPDGHFDWIYIDADHSYAGVVRDARASAPKLKPGGFLVFNDFAHIDPQLGRYGVHRAVVEFAIAERWPMRFFAFNGAALYDVALCKAPVPLDNTGQ